jgi:beta-aspartyl-peptidase (threonine type)
MAYSLAIHGGAGALIASRYTDRQISDYHEALGKVLERGQDLLKSGLSSLETVVEVVSFLEDDPLFNAGRGSVLASNREAIMDACVMDGQNLRSGSVSLIRQIKNPIRGAELVMSKSPHAFLSGQDADTFCLKHGLEKKNPNYFITATREKQLERLKDSGEIEMDHEEPADKMGTVGAVALDQKGDLAAATSTGGMANKHPARVSDSAIPGAGNFADNRSCAISCTGIGDPFIQQMTAKEISDRIRFAGEPLAKVSRSVFSELKLKGGEGGFIAILPSGEIFMDFTSRGMFRGSVTSTQSPHTALF